MPSAGEIPADASSMIYVAKANAVELLHRVFPRVDVPPAVWREAVIRGEEKGAPEVIRIRQAERRAWLRQTTLTPAQHRASRSLAAASRLGEGESQVIAVTRPGQRCILDDKRAVRVARNRGIRPISTLLVPVIGWRRNLINADEAVRLVRLLGVASGALAETTLVLEEEITGGPQ